MVRPLKLDMVSLTCMVYFALACMAMVNLACLVLVRLTWIVIVSPGCIAMGDKIRGIFGESECHFFFLKKEEGIIKELCHYLLRTHGTFLGKNNLGELYSNDQV